MKIHSLKLNCLKYPVTKSNCESYYDEVLSEVLNFYDTDFHADNLKTQLKLFRNMIQDQNSKEFGYGDIITLFKNLKPEQRNFISEVFKVVELILVLPASNAALERSFSQMKIIKSRFRCRMKSKRLNHYMLMGHYKEMTDRLDLEKLAVEFIKRNEKRQKILGKPLE